MDYTLLLLSLLPSVVLLWMFLSSDKYPEPPGAVAVAFLLGMLIPVVLLTLYPLFVQARALFPADNPYAAGTLEAFLLAAAPEESLKFAVLYGLCRRFPAFDEPMDGIVYGVTVAVGFATFENLAYVRHGGYMTAAARGILTVPGHAMDGAIMGYFAGQAVFGRGPKRRLLAKALFLPMLLHGLFDAALMIPAYAEDMGVPLPGAASVALSVLFFTVVLRQIGYVAGITGKVRREQEPGPLPMPDAEPEREGEGSRKGPAAVAGLIVSVAGELAADMRRSDVVCVVRHTRTGMDMLLAAICLLGLVLTMGLGSTAFAEANGGVWTAQLLLFAIGSALFGFRSVVGLIENLSPNRLRRLRERDRAPGPESAPSGRKEP